MAEETKTLRHTAEEIDDAIDKLPSNGNAAGIYKSSLSFSSIVNDGNVTQDHLTEINAIYEAWKSGRMVYVLDEKGEYYNLGVLNMQLAEDNSKCSFVALDQDGVLCYYSCNPSSGVTGKWSVTPIGNDLFALIQHTHKASDVTEETNKRFVTDEEKDELNTLSTTYAKADLSNAMTVSLGQNGYAKFNNGLLIQWGYFSAGASNNQSINFPVSFKSCFSLAFSSSTDNTDNSIWSVNYAAIYASYFTVYRRYANSGSVSPSSQSFRWIAIGSWKQLIKNNYGTKNVLEKRIPRHTPRRCNRDYEKVLARIVRRSICGKAYCYQ